MLNITSAIDNSLLSLIIVKMVQLHNAPCKPTHFVHLYILIFELKVGMNLKARQGLVNCVKANSANIIFSLFWPWQQYSLPDILYTNIFANIYWMFFYIFQRDSDKRDPCKFLFKNGYCNYGPNCIFYHDRERYEKEFPNAETRYCQVNRIFRFNDSKISFFDNYILIDKFHMLHYVFVLSQ